MTASKRKKKIKKPPTKKISQKRSGSKKSGIKVKPGTAKSSQKRKTAKKTVKLVKVVKSKRQSGATKSKISKRSSSRQRQQDEDVLLFSQDNIQVIKQPEPTKRQVASNQGIKINESQININSSSRPSRHLVDLKKQQVFTVPEEEARHKPNFEEQLAAWEAKFARPKATKANFITSAAIKQAKVLRKRQPGKLKRLTLLLSSKISSYIDKFTVKIQTWGDTKATAYLTKISDRHLSEQEPAATEVVKEELEEPILATKKSSLRLFPLSLAGREVKTSLAVFIVMALVLTLPLKAFTFYNEIKLQGASVLGASTSIYKDLGQGLGAFGRMDFSQASDDFLSASQNLLDIREVIDEYPAFLLSLAKVVPEVGDKISLATNLVEVANSLAQTGAIMSQILAQTIGADNLPTDRLITLNQGFKQISYLLSQANKSLSSIDLANVPTDYQEKVGLLKSWLPVGLEVINKAVEITDFATAFLGHDIPQRYLVIFQNSNELRPTGGFMGTIAEVDIKQGKVQKIYIPPGGVYDLQGDLEVLLAAPKPLRMLNANWQTQDANWWFDFPTSAKKIIWFYEKSGGPTVDGLIAINSNLLPKLLAVTGPIYLPDFDITLNKDNVIATIQKEVEINYDKELNQPKKIISQLAPVLLDKLQQTQGQDFLNLFSVFNDALASRDIQLYHQDQAMQEKIMSLGWAGEVKDSRQDYLAIINTNVGGNKTDGVIDQQVYLRTEINEAGEIINHLKIVKKHSGDLSDAFTGHANVDYLRVYVPLGSKLVAAAGFYKPLPTDFSSPSEGFTEDSYLQSVEVKPIVDEQTGTRITQEFGKTVFANYVKVRPGEKVEASLSYRLPFRLKFRAEEQPNIVVQYFNKLISLFGLEINDYQEVATYSALWQKQSGQKPLQIVHELQAPDSWTVLSSPSLQNKIVQYQGNVYYQSELGRDDFWGVILTR